MQEKKQPDKKQASIKQQHRNTGWLFQAALGASLAAIIILSTSFFRVPFDTRDADFGIINIALLIILGYAGYNKSVQWQCSHEERKARRGGTIFGIIMGWGFLMYWLYQTRLVEHYLGLDWKMEVPAQFYTFLTGVVIIFLGSKAADFFDFRSVLNKLGRNNSEEGKGE